jgi:hypothetical protein
MKSEKRNFLEPSGPLQACNGTALPIAVVMKSGNLNFLEPSGPLQACNGTALIFFFTMIALRIIAALLMQCVEAVADGASPDLSFMHEAVHVSCLNYEQPYYCVAPVNSVHICT